MQIGIGIPNAVPGATGADLLEWARRADRAGFSSLASIGAVSYPGYEELTVFAAAAALRAGARSTLVRNRLRSVTAAAAANTVSSS